jgi:arylsulfatase A-like enzyme
MDAQIESILREVDPDGNAILVVTADHGEEFFERGHVGHRFSLHAELQRIPLLIRTPGAEPRRVHAPVSLIDVLPTLLDLVGAPAPGDIEGRSLVPYLEGRFEPRIRPVLAHRAHAFLPARELYAVVDRSWKLILDGDSAELFDRAQDPLEEQDVSGEHPAQVERLRNIIDRWSESARDAETTEVTLDPAQISELRALGYAESPTLGP